MRLAVIPARGGSKRIPRKNIRDFCGRPMIAWSIEAAKNSGCFDHIVVSTDDDEIAAVAEKEGAEVPFRRPVTLADDHTPTIPVIAHAIDACEAYYGNAAKEVCCIYATAPFVRGSDLCTGLNLLREGPYSYVFPVASYPFPIQRALRRGSSGAVEMFSPENSTRRSQDLEDLDEHNLITYGNLATSPIQDIDWILEEGAKKKRIPILKINNIYGVLQAVKSGIGIGSLPDYLVQGYMNITKVLEHSQAHEFPAYFVYTQELRKSKRIAAFRDFIEKEFKNSKF